MELPVSNQQSLLPVDADRLRNAAAGVLRDAGYRSGSLSIAVVDDATIHELNRRHLAHDYATDVLSFAIEDEGDHLEGEVIVSAETALANAPDYGWPADDELLLYVIHGALHLAGYRDKTDGERLAMRRAEAACLRRCGVTPPGDETLASPSGARER